MSLIGRSFNTPFGPVAILNRTKGNTSTKGFCVHLTTHSDAKKRSLTASLDKAFEKHADGSYNASLSEISDHIKAFTNR